MHLEMSCVNGDRYSWWGYVTLLKLGAVIDLLL